MARRTRNRGGSGAGGRGLSSARLFGSALRGLPDAAIQPFSTRESLFSAADDALAQFEAFTKQVADAIGADHFTASTRPPDDYTHVTRPLIVVAPLKSAARAAEKVAADYGGAWERLLDVVRGSIVVAGAGDIPEVILTLLEVMRAQGWTLARSPKNRFTDPPASGYRDLLLTLAAPGGFLCELQIHVAPMMQAKQAAHQHYETVRSLAARLHSEGRIHFTPDEQAAFESATRQMEEAYEQAWRDAGG